MTTLGLEVRRYYFAVVAAVVTVVFVVSIIDDILLILGWADPSSFESSVEKLHR